VSNGVEFACSDGVLSREVVGAGGESSWTRIVGTDRTEMSDWPCLLMALGLSMFVTITEFHSTSKRPEYR